MLTSCGSWNNVIESIAQIFQKQTKQPNNGKYDDNGTGNEERVYLVSAHITMESWTDILAANSYNDAMWEIIDDDDIGSLAGLEELICWYYILF